MWPDRRLIELLQIGHPLVLAPMAGFATAELAASVCAAGGLGSIGLCHHAAPVSDGSHRETASTDKQAVADAT